MEDDSDTEESLATRMAVRRGRLRLTQEEVALSAGVTLSYVNQLERGKRVPRWKRLADIARALDTTPEWLMTGKVLTDEDDILGGVRMVVEARGLTRRDVDKIEQFIRIMFPLEGQ